MTGTKKNVQTSEKNGIVPPACADKRIWHLACMVHSIYIYIYCRGVYGKLSLRHSIG